MTALRRLGWPVLLAVTAALAIAVWALKLPEPKASIVIDRATMAFGSETAQPVALPHTIFPVPETARELRLTIQFDVGSPQDRPLFVLIPSLNRQASLLLNGEILIDTEARTLWLGPFVTTSLFVQLPKAMLTAGRNELTVVNEAGPYVAPIHLPKIYIGDEAALAPTYKLRVVLDQRLKTMALAAHVLLGLGIIFAFFLRPKDPLFAWLAAMISVSFVLSSTLFAGIQPHLQAFVPYVVALTPTLGLLGVGVAIAVIGRRPPRALKIATVAVTAVSVLSIALADTTRAKLMLNVAQGGLLIVVMVVALAIVAWAAFRERSIDARLMLPSYFLLTWFLLRDASSAFIFIDDTFILISPYARPLFLAAVIVVLMRRLAATLNDLDRSNETLNARLAEREAELAALHREEQIEASRLVREEERQRLTRDLHDGISGHLVSIIAMSERSSRDVQPIEQAARAALDDLRLVIYSLDLGDTELPLALANFRERLIPQLNRIGVTLEWSTADLPDVSGVTPGNALMILRIMQEAITNAVKHGPARTISVRGSAGPDGKVVIAIENDGRRLGPTQAGLGLPNMRRRAAQLHGELNIQSLDHGVRVTLMLPSRLPDLRADAPHRYVEPVDLPDASPAGSSPAAKAS